MIHSFECCPGKGFKINKKREKKNKSAMKFSLAAALALATAHIGTVDASLFSLANVSFLRRSVMSSGRILKLDTNTKATETL